MGKNEDFHNLQTTKLGDIGEEIVDKWLYMEGFDGWGTSDIYVPNHNGSHIIDRVMFLSGSVICFDVKTKSSRDLYSDVGIDTNDYKKYKMLANSGVHVMLFFVDVKLGKCYGGFLGDIDKEYYIGRNRYPLHSQTSYGFDVTYFPIDIMKEYFVIEEEDLVRLRKFSKK